MISRARPFTGLHFRFSKIGKGFSHATGENATLRGAALGYLRLRLPRDLKQPGKRELCCQVLPGTPAIVFGDGGGLVEIQYPGGGFLLVRREVYVRMQTQLQLPLCHEPAQRPQVPSFQPLVSAEGGVSRYLPDDYAFRERARRYGYRIHADTTIRLSRLASYAYSWEEAGTLPRRYARFDLHLPAG